MANLVETNRWEAGIYQFETSDPVMGGPNGIDNRPTRELANRTLWLKTELAKAVQSIGSNKTAADAAYARKTTALTAGAGLTGGGTLGGNVSFSLGTPSDLTENSTSESVSNTHSHKLPRASTSARGIVKLNNTLTGTAADEALTAAQGKALKALIDGVSDGSFKLRGEIPATQNLNGLSAPDQTGVWHQSANARSLPGLNYPVQYAGTLFVLPAVAGGTQVYIPYNNTGIWTRTQTSGSSGWNAWKQLGSDKAAQSVVMNAGNGLTGGGDLSQSRTLTLGIPSSIGATSTNSVGSNTHSHAVDKASTTQAGIVKLNNSLTSDSTVEALTAAQGKALKGLTDGKLGNSGNQTLTNGVLNIQRNAWEKLRFTNPDGSFWRFEAEPVGNNANGARFNFVFNGAGGGSEVGRVAFPRVEGGETAAYQSWVNARITAEKPYLQTINYYDDQSGGYAQTGFYRGNGAQIDGKNTSPMEIHIAHPSYTNNAYARGIGFAYGGNFGLYTTSWDKDGVYQGMKTVLTEENGVMLTGNQTIGGVKTLSGGMLKIDRSGRLAEIGVGAADTYLMNRTSNKALQLKDDGTLAYSNDKIMLYSDRSDAVNLNDTSKLATSRAVKTAYDKAAAAETAAGLAGPAGTVAFIAGAYAPAGWLKCNGAAVSRTTYAKLFAAIGTHYGAGNGSTTFNLPDLRGEFIRCLDDGRGVDVGRVLGTVQTDAMQQWFAELTLQRAQVNREEIVNGAVQFLSSDKSNAIPGGGWAVSRTIIGPAVNNSARTAAETRPRNIALLPIIKI